MKRDQMIANRYAVEREIGRGGMGVVYLAEDTNSGDRVAVKSMRSDGRPDDSGWIDRFQQEGEALRQLDHPNIVKMLATAEDNGQQFIVMEYVDGGTLAQRVNVEEKLEISDVLSVALQIADALTRSHYLNIIHRDLKPGNVLLTEEGLVRLTDFGLARLQSSDMTESGAVLGTLAYMSPEALQGRPLDERTDIWSFGVLLFEMLSGKKPFESSVPGAAVYAILSQPVPDLELMRPGAPASLVDLVYRMLQKDPDQRIPSVRLVGAELESIERRIDGTDSMSQSFLTDARSREWFVSQTSEPVAELKHNLPTETTPFVGRQADLAAVTGLLDEPGVRLVTILAPGGMGKTRLAIEAARLRLGAYSDGVVFVPLAGLDSVEALIPAIWDSAGYPPVHASSRTPHQQLLDFLRQKRMLLIMDNFEHLLDGVGLLGDILKAAPGVTVLSTSIERLRLQSETLYRLEGMDYPAASLDAKSAGVDTLSSYSAIRLFIQTAQRRQPGFELGPGEEQHVVEICRLVQGLPLGILLAAAWTDALSAEEIAAEINQCFDFLETDMRDLPARQRSVRATFEHCWGRLMEAEQDAYARLSVFRGGFTREAAQAVAGASVRDLMSLVNKSLLWRDPENGRYRQHRLLRDYASNRLRARGEEQETRRKHAQFYTELAEELDERLRGPNELPFYVQMADESRNFSAVLEWSFAKTENAVLGGRLFGALGWNWFVVDNTVDGPYWMERALTFLDAYPPAVRARVLNRSGFIGCTIGAYHQAAEQHHEAVRLFRQLNDNWQVSWALLAEANMSYSAGMADRAYVLSKESLKLAYHEEEPLLLHWALRTAAYHEALQDHHERAERLYEESFQIADFLENRRARMNAYFSKAEFALKYRHADDVEENYWRALEIAREIGRKSGVVNATLGLGLASYLHGDYRKASAFGQQALEMSQDIGHHTLSAEALVELGLYAIRNLDLEGAAAYFIRCLQMTQHTDMAARQAISVFGLGLFATENEPNEWAAKMFAAAESALKDLDLHVELAIFASEWDRAFAEYRPRLDSEAWETGGNMSLDQAVALALKSWPQQSILT